MWKKLEYGRITMQGGLGSTWQETGVHSFSQLSSNVKDKGHKKLSYDNQSLLNEVCFLRFEALIVVTLQK
jgi:hypothetical protein